MSRKTMMLNQYTCSEVLHFFYNALWYETFFLLSFGVSLIVRCEGTELVTNAQVSFTASQPHLYHSFSALSHTETHYPYPYRERTTILGPQPGSKIEGS